MPLLGLLKWLRLMHDDVLVILMVVDVSGVIGGGKEGGKEGRAGAVRQVQGAVKMGRGKKNCGGRFCPDRDG